jgi:WhiB family redox-sensing transcriptional regulator
MLRITPAYPKYTGKEPCRSTDPDAFFAEVFQPKLNVQLRRICGACPMIEACSEYAIRFEDVGFWGGLTPTERRNIRRARGVRLRNDSRQYAA